MTEIEQQLWTAIYYRSRETNSDLLAEEQASEAVKSFRSADRYFENYDPDED